MKQKKYVFGAVILLSLLATQLNTSPLTAQQNEEYKEAFAAFDEDGNGAISVDEFDGMMESKGQSLPGYQLRRIFEEADADSNGMLDMTEFIAMM